MPQKASPAGPQIHVSSLYAKEFPQTDTQKIVVDVNSYTNRARLDVRTWFLGDDGLWHPTRKGVQMQLELVERVAQAMVDLAEQFLQAAKKE